MRINNAAPSLQARIKPGPVVSTTTDDEIQARAALTAHNLAVPVQVLEHLFKLERRISQLEYNAQECEAETQA
jgi:hypothetical protein